MDNMTAKMSAFARAYHYINNETHVFADSKAEMILGDDYEKIAACLAQGIPFFLPNHQGTREEGLRKIVDGQISPSVLARSAYCEKMLQNERRLGCGQYILFASGYDTYSVRNIENDLRVFELDLPVMIEDKKARIEKAGLVSDAVYVPCDLSKSGWEEELVRKGFKTTTKSFGSLLGITYYLEKKDFEILLRRIGSLMVQGSAICFDYQTAEESAVTKKNEALAAGAGEQMKAAYSLDELELILQNCGFLIYEHLNHEEITGQYFEDYNAKNPRHIMQAPEGVGYILAVREANKSIEIKLADRSNFTESSMDSFDRFQEVRNVYRIENGKLVLKNNPFTETWSPERKREKASEILSGQYITYCAFDGNAVVGEIMLMPELNEGRMIIDSFHVSRDYRRHGIGRQMIEAVTDYAKSRGAEALYASCCSAEETVAFYMAMGFSPSAHPIPACVRDEPFDVQMECRL